MVAWHIFICVDAANEVVHELVAEPVQEPWAEEQQEDAVEPALEGFVNPADLQGKPRVLAGVIQTSGWWWEQLTCVAQRGFHVSCGLGPPCKVKLDRFAISLG